jgi:hypothetical protein
MTELRTDDRILDTVDLVERTRNTLRFRVTDPTLDGTDPDLCIFFSGVEQYVGGEHFSSALLRPAELPASVDATDGLRAFEFVAEEIRPTAGRPFQAQLHADGTTSILFGEKVVHRLAFVVARAVVLTTEAEAGEPATRRDRNELQTNTLQHLADTLAQLASSDQQRRYKAKVPFVQVPRELLAQWDNHYRLSTEVPWVRDLFSAGHLAALKEFDHAVAELRQAHPDLPDVPRIFDIPQWQSLARAAAALSAALGDAVPPPTSGFAGS